METPSTWDEVKHHYTGIWQGHETTKWFEASRQKAQLGAKKQSDNYTASSSSSLTNRASSNTKSTNSGRKTSTPTSAFPPAPPPCAGRFICETKLQHKVDKLPEWRTLGFNMVQRTARLTHKHPLIVKQLIKKMCFCYCHSSHLEPFRLDQRI